MTIAVHVTSTRAPTLQRLAHLFGGCDNDKRRNAHGPIMTDAILTRRFLMLLINRPPATVGLLVQPALDGLLEN